MKKKTLDPAYYRTKIEKGIKSSGRRMGLKELIVAVQEMEQPLAKRPAKKFRR